jgi:glycerol-3-phosphate cytidylyltransferase
MIKGVIAGAFDVIHPGYIDMFKQTKSVCDELTVLLHTDPTIERPEKLKPVLSGMERIEMLLALSAVDRVMTYTLEEDLYRILKQQKFGVRFLGDDYKNKSFTGDDLKISIHFLNRDHGWSTTRFKKLIAESYEKSNNS